MNGDDDDRSTLDEAMADVAPLRDGPARVPPATPRRRGPTPDAPEIAFERGADAHGAFGVATSVDRAHLQALRTGRPATGRRVDLHGLSEDAARSEVVRALRAAHAEGIRCVALIHGRGVHSASEPVLRGALPDWLCAPPLAAIVLAFAPAPGREGGSGATRVLLRRVRRVRG